MQSIAYLFYFVLLQYVDLREAAHFDGLRRGFSMLAHISHGLKLRLTVSPGPGLLTTVKIDRWESWKVKYATVLV